MDRKITLCDLIKVTKITYDRLTYEICYFIGENESRPVRQQTNLDPVNMRPIIQIMNIVTGEDFQLTKTDLSRTETYEPV